MIATGPDLREAMWLAAELETLCKQYALALQIGTPRGTACGGSHARHSFSESDKGEVRRAGPVAKRGASQSAYEGSCRGYYCSDAPP